MAFHVWYTLFSVSLKTHPRAVLNRSANTAINLIFFIQVSGVRFSGCMTVKNVEMPLPLPLLLCSGRMGKNKLCQRCES